MTDGEAPCYSCGDVVPLAGNYCHGCQRIICQPCAEAYEHWLGGRHGLKRYDGSAEGGSTEEPAP